MRQRVVVLRRTHPGHEQGQITREGKGRRHEQFGLPARVDGGSGTQELVS